MYTELANRSRKGSGHRPLLSESERMSDDRSASKTVVDRGQNLKRTHDMSFGAAKEGHANDTDNPGRGGENSSPERVTEEVSTE